MKEAFYSKIEIFIDELNHGMPGQRYDSNIR